MNTYFSEGRLLGESCLLFFYFFVFYFSFSFIHPLSLLLLFFSLLALNPSLLLLTLLFTHFSFSFSFFLLLILFLRHYLLLLVSLQLHNLAINEAKHSTYVSTSVCSYVQTAIAKLGLTLHQTHRCPPGVGSAE